MLYFPCNALEDGKASAPALCDGEPQKTHLSSGTRSEPRKALLESFSSTPKRGVH